MDRRRRTLGSVDLRAGRILEVGALDKPIVGRPEFDVWYADYTDTASLQHHYESAEILVGHDPAAFVDVDFVLDGRPLAELAAEVAPFHAVVASHVIEHIPDLVRWFDDLSSVLVPGGHVCLAIPDRRYCFDARRATTELADVVEAHLEQRTRPSPRAYFDFAWSFVPVDAAHGWKGEVPTVVGEDVASVYRRTRDYALQTDGYQDVHVWALTPDAFETIVNALGAMGLTDLRIAVLDPTGPGEGEFFAQLVKQERTSPVGAIHVGLANAELHEAQAQREALRDQVHELLHRRPLHRKVLGRLKRAVLRRPGLTSEDART